MSDRNLIKFIVALALIATSAVVFYQSSLGMQWYKVTEFLVEGETYRTLIELPEGMLWGISWGSVLMGAGAIQLLEVLLSRLGIGWTLKRTLPG